MRLVLGRLSSLTLGACLLTACPDDPGPEAFDPTDGAGSGTDDTPQPDDGPDDDDDDETDAGSEDAEPDESDSGSGSDGMMTDQGDPFEPAPTLPTLPEDTVATIAAGIDAALATAPGTTQTVLVVDAETGQQIYARNPDTFLKPASNTKLLTTAVAMETLGEDHRMPTEIWLDAEPDGNGDVDGAMHMVMHHDFSWSGFFFVAPDLALDRLAVELYDLGLRSISGGLVVHGEAVYNGGQFNTYNAGAHRNTVASVFSSSLSQAGITLMGGTSTAGNFNTPGELFYTWQSPPLATGANPTNVESHNEFADVMARHNGFELEGASSYEAGETALLEWLASIPIATKGMAINDGSGLSHDNRVSARVLVDMLAFMLEQPSGLAWVRTFAVAGVRGTLEGRMLGVDTWGRVWGKTGTLTGVIATSGIAFNRHDGRRYLVGMMMNDVSNNTTARNAQNGVFEVVAGDHWGTPRPEAPVLHHVRAAASDIVEITWSPVDGADQYLVWLSPDGKVWRREDARLVDGPMHRAGDIPFGPDVYVRVSAVGTGGESDPSDAYGSRAEDGEARVLVVDGFDRWEAEPAPDNPLGGSHDFVVTNGHALAGAAIWDSADNEAVVNGEIALADYDAVIWSLGEESTDDDTFDPAEQDAVADYLAGGGNLLVSGSELGWDLSEHGDPADMAFLSETLHVEYIGDEAQTFYVVGEAGAFEAVGPVGFFTPGTMQANFADQLAPAEGAEAIASYYGGFGGTAAVAFEGDHNVVVLGIPFECIDNAESRATFMAGVLERFGL